MSKKSPSKARSARRFVNDALQDAIPVDAAITIAAPAEKIFEYWRDGNNLPKFFRQLSSIKAKSGRVSEWTWKALKGAVEIKWESEITAEKAPTHLSWRSLEGSALAHAGEIVLTPLPEQHATELRLHLDYAPPGGKITDFLTHVFGEAPAELLQDDLRRLRQLIEVGYLATTEGQPKGNESNDGKTSSRSKEQK